jgi:Glycosyltransferase family 87
MGSRTTNLRASWSPLLRRNALWILSGAGLAIRLILAFGWYGNGDLWTFEIVAVRTEQGPLHTYAGNVDQVLYPYPPGYLLWLVGALKVARGTGLPFHGVVQLLPILADAAIAVAVYVYLGWRGASEGARLVGFALVMLGPAFIAISGYHGQLDAVAILPGVLALMAWERRPQARRAVESGLLIGLGVLVKTVPGLLILPLLVTARSVKEGVRLVAATAGVALIAALPFLLAEPEGYRKVLSYAGVPGRGGLSVVLDPGFAADRRLSPGLSVLGSPNELADWISRSGGPITLVVLLALAAFLIRYRPAPIDSIVLLWLAVFAVSPNFLLQYVVWAMPFFIMAGYLRQTALLQLALVPVLVITYLSFSAMTDFLAGAYVAMMICLWVFWVVALVTLVRRIIRHSASHPGAIQAPLVELRPVVSAS